MVKNKKKIICSIAIAAALAMIFFAAWYSEFSKEYYIKYEGEYYKILGAITYEENVQEFVGEVKRVAPRTFWNRDGDTNFTFEGARIGIVSDGDYAVERTVYIVDTGEIRSDFWMMVPIK